MPLVRVDRAHTRGTGGNGCLEDREYGGSRGLRPRQSRGHRKHDSLQVAERDAPLDTLLKLCAVMGGTLTLAARPNKPVLFLTLHRGARSSRHDIMDEPLPRQKITCMPEPLNVARFLTDKSG